MEGQAWLGERRPIVAGAGERAVALGRRDRGLERRGPRREVGVSPRVAGERAHGLRVTPTVPMCRKAARWSFVNAQKAGFQKTSSLTRRPPGRRRRHARRYSKSI